MKKKTEEMTYAVSRVLEIIWQIYEAIIGTIAAIALLWLFLFT